MVEAASGLSRQAAKEAAARAIAERSPLLLKLFGAYCRRDLASSFHGVRLLGELPSVEGPLVVIMNHPSWWDTELFAYLATTVFADRRGFVPMAARNVARYPILKRFGTFPTKQRSFSGAFAFLTVAEEVLKAPDSLMFVTFEGHYSDVRLRPIRPLPGVAYLARRMPALTVVPLAIEYVFWNERRPNLLLSFGEPIGAPELASMPTTAAATAHIATALEARMSALAEASQSRDPQRFRTLIKGRDGMIFFYDLWRRVRALAAGRRYNAAYRGEP